MTRRRLARRSIPVAVDVPTQLPLALAWTDPIERAARQAPEPGPAPVALLVRRAA